MDSKIKTSIVENDKLKLCFCCIYTSEFYSDYVTLTFIKYDRAALQDFEKKNCFSELSKGAVNKIENEGEKEVIRIIKISFSVRYPIIYEKLYYKTFIL